MATPTPVRALLRQSSKLPTIPLRSSTRCLHSTPPRRESKTYRQTGPLPKVYHPAERQPKWRREQPVPDIPASEAFPRYTQEELQFLATKYTPEQMEALMAGEGAIDPQDLMDQGVARNDYMKPDYLDDFARIHPVLDKKRLAPASHYDPNLRYKTDEELDEDLTRFVDQLPVDSDSVEFAKFNDNLRMTVGKEEAERQPIDYMAPALPKMTDPLVKRVAKRDNERDYPMKEMYQQLSKRLGLSVKYMRDLKTKQMSTHRVVNQTRMGKIQSQWVMVICGNGNGLIGIGEGKHDEASVAVEQATMKAIADMRPVPRYEQRTIFGDVRGKVSGTVVELYNRPPGFGCRVQEKIYEICKCAGISDLSARTLRSSNPMNVVKATVQALQKQRLPEDVARGRGKKMVDVRKVYYAAAN